MKRYKAYAIISYELDCEFEVPEGADPWDIAQELDGGDFRELQGTADWRIYEVQEVSE